jgi:ABC-type multidrug transport system permease subunit
MVSRAPTSALILGRAAAITILGLVCGVLAVVVVVLFTGRLPPGDDLPLVLLSLAVGGVTVLCISVLMSPLNLIADAKAGFFNGIIPLLFFFSGLIFPASRLPGALEWVPKLLPTSWAMEAVVGAGQGAPRGDVLQDLGVAIALTAIFFLFAKVGFDIVERRVRVSGILGRS